MKKLIATCILFFLVATGKTYAQGAWKTSNGGWSRNPQEKGTADLKLIKGENSVKIPQGSVTFFIDGAGKVTKAYYQDLLGRSTQLIPVKRGTSGVPDTECKYPLPDGCFGTADKSIGLCICKPSDISSGIHTVSYYVFKHISNVN